jgi:hypothetical protein
MDATLVQLLASGPNWAEKTTAVATAVLAAGAFIAYLTLKDARKTRHAQLLTDLSERWDDRYMSEAITLARQYGSDGTLKLVEALWGPAVTKVNEDDMNDWLKMSIYPNLIETLGVYVSERLITADIAYKLWGGNIMSAWNDWANSIYRLRELTKTPEVWEYFQFLAVRMRELLEVERAGTGKLRPGGF